jgi:multidrug efflux system membrane fusion protein
VQRGPAGTFSYVIGDDDVVSARPVTVTQQNETEAVVASGIAISDRVVTTGFANLAEGAKVIVGRDEQTPQADLAPRKRGRRDSQAKEQPKDQAKDQVKDGQPRGEPAQDGQGRQGKKDWQNKDGEHRRRSRDGGQDGQGTPAGRAQGSDQSGGAKQP